MEQEAINVKHILLSIFIILLTLTCCIVMYSFKVPDIPVYVQQSEEQPEKVASITQEDENKEVSSDISNDNQQKMNYSRKDDYEKPEVVQIDDVYDNYAKDVKDYSTETDNYKSMVFEGKSASSSYKSTAASSLKYEAAAMEAQNLLTLKEKIYLIGIARYLDSSDFSLIKKYIAEGATQKELDGLWEQIRKKLPEDDYNKVYSIFLKYKR